MTTPSTEKLTQLLLAWSEGDREALEKLAPLVEAELHKLAKRYMSGERPDHTLQTTALVNEVYIRLIDGKNVRWQNRAHFFAVSAQMMRRILVDFARSRPSLREGKAFHVSLDEDMLAAGVQDVDLVALDDALEALKTFDPRKCLIVELKFFGGLSAEETAEVLKLSAVTVMREWNKAKAWLYRELSREKDLGD